MLEKYSADTKEANEQLWADLKQSWDLQKEIQP
jgi:hypothetical protein